MSDNATYLLILRAQAAILDKIEGAIEDIDIKHKDWIADSSLGDDMSR